MGGELILDVPGWAFSVFGYVTFAAFVWFAACVCILPVFAVMKFVESLGNAFDGLSWGFLGIVWSIRIMLSYAWNEFEWLLLELLGWLLFG